MKLKFFTQFLLMSFVLSNSFVLKTEAQTLPRVGSGSGTNLTPKVIQGGGSSSTPTVAPTTPAPAPATSAPGNTSFSCIPQSGGSVATVGQRPGGQPVPLITWTAEGSSYFGEKYTTQNRCNIVTQKINTVVSANGGRLKNVKLTNGTVNSQTVICALNASESGCKQDGSNVLFTLKPENATKAGAILNQLIQMSQGNSSAGVIRETDGQVYVDLGAWEEQALGAKTSTPASSGTTTDTSL
ncbi:COP23 domain-containing protein [Scytonema sp. PRP1]|uniref:COP23 domain-containing protein n=1 Tax=Scytonema sp. PRP1 TaxID=3120513 RepID=UPI00300D7634